MVSPSKIKGTIFLEKLLPVIKNSRVTDDVTKLLIKFVVSLDDSIADRTEEYRKEFLSEITNSISAILDTNECN